MKKSRLFSLLTAAVLTVTGFWQNAALTASAEPDFSGAEIPDASSIAYSENSFGAMIADTINEENARIMMNSVVHDVEMNGTEATVSYDSTQAGRAVVCVYEDTAADSAPRLLGTGIQAFTAELNTVTVSVKMKALPDYYLVRVYLIGENDVPLSAEYSDPMHTREMHMLKQSDISAFMEDYEVLNLDGSTETNFAVYKKDVTVLHYSRTENYVLSQDNENCVFEIRNYTGPTKTGTIVSVECGNGTAAIFKIGSVKTDGDVTTIQGDRSMKTNDAFLYVKMETNTENNEYSYTPPELPEEYANLEISGSVINGQKPAQGRPGNADGETAGSEEVTRYSGEKMFRIQLGKGADYDNDKNKNNHSDAGVAVEIDGIVEFAFEYDITIYQTTLFDHIEMNCSDIFNYGIELSATAEIKVPLGAAVIFNPCGDINFTLGPYLVASITGIVRITGTLESSFGTESGVEAKPFVADFSVSAEGFIGFGIGGELGVCGRGGELSLEVGIKVALNPNEPHKGCQICYAVTLSLEVRFTASIDLGLFDLGIAPTKDFTIGSAYCSDTLGFGFGECPNLNNPPEDAADNPGDWVAADTDDGLTAEQRRMFAFEEVSDGFGVRLNNSYYTQPGTSTVIPEIPTYYKGAPVVEILPYAFSAITHIQGVTLPRKLKRIGEHAFSSSPDINHVCWFKANSIWFPETLETIGSGAFSGSYLTSLQLPESLKTIGDHAFSSGKFTTLVLPKSLQSIGEYAFANSSVQTVIFQESDSPDAIKTIPRYAFSSCAQLKSVRFPSDLQTIEDHAFYNSCDFPLNLPSSVREIGDSAFSCKSDLEASKNCPQYDIQIPSFALKIGSNVFGNRYHINTMRFPLYFTGAVNDDLFASDASPSIQCLELPQNWTTVPSHFLKNCMVSQVILPTRLKEIEESAFESSRIEQIYLPKTLKKIGKGAFKDCLQLESVSISPSASFTEIEEDTFMGCWVLEQINIPNSVKMIGDRAFEDCCKLKSIVIPKSVESMYFRAFNGYTSNTVYPVSHTDVKISDTTTEHTTTFEYSSSRSITFLNPNIQFLDDPALLKSDYIPEGRNTPTIEYGNFLTLIGYPNSTAQVFAQDADHKCNFIGMTGSSQTTQPSQPVEPTDAPQTMTFTGLLPNTVYNFYDLLGEKFTTANLLYLSQGVSDEAGTLTVFYRPKSDDTDAKKYVKCASTEKPVSKIKGDANGDFVVDVSDAVLCARFCAEDAEAIISRQGVLNADVDGDGNTSSDDTILILQFIARRITSFD